MDEYTDMVLVMWERLAKDVQFDLIEFWEDMASKNGPFISPATFKEFMKPNYLKVVHFAERHGIEILLVDCDGNIEQLTEMMLDAGITALYPYEVQAGTTLRQCSTNIQSGIIGGLDKNAMAKGRDAIDQEMEKARQLIRKGRFIPGPDHFVLSDVTFANYHYSWNGCGMS